MLTGCNALGDIELGNVAVRDDVTSLDVVMRSVDDDLQMP